MSFMRNMANFARSVGEGAKVGRAYALVSQYFHLGISTEMMERTRPDMVRWAETSSIPDLSLIYLWHYRRQVMNLGTDSQKAQLKSQFESFVKKVAALQDRGERFGDYPLQFFCEAAAHSGADPSALRKS